MSRHGTGTPTPFATFETACQWFALMLKETEKAGAAARIWARLTGPAKSVVRHLDPQLFYNAEALELLLEKLRRSPLQALPIPDSFQKLERWSNMKRRDQEPSRGFFGARGRELCRAAAVTKTIHREISSSGAPRLPEETCESRGPEAADDQPGEVAGDEHEDFEDLPDFRKASPSSSPRRQVFGWQGSGGGPEEYPCGC